MKQFIFSVLSILIFFGACQNSETIVPNAISFEELTPEQTGITFENTLDYKPYLNIIDYLYYYNGGGVAVGDINNDGLEDLILPPIYCQIDCTSTRVTCNLTIFLNKPESAHCPHGPMVLPCRTSTTMG